jgi:Family of unknown function (DUF6144)
MAKKRLPALENLALSLKRLAGKEAEAEVMEGSEMLAETTEPEKIALWLKGAMERLDKATDKRTRTRIMEECGAACAEANHGTIDRVVAKRRKYSSLEEFLDAEKDKLLPGMRLEPRGKTLYQYYLPQSYRSPMRCFCSLLRGLPLEETVSPTYCQCSKGFVQRMWERVLGRPVKAEVLETAVTGARECKFRIEL